MSSQNSALRLKILREVIHVLKKAPASNKLTLLLNGHELSQSFITASELTFFKIFLTFDLLLSKEYM